MSEFFWGTVLSSSVLILILLVLRRLCKGRIRLRLQYGLWLLVALRLLLPWQIGSLDWSVQNLLTPQALANVGWQLQIPQLLPLVQTVPETATDGESAATVDAAAAAAADAGSSSGITQPSAGETFGRAQTAVKTVGSRWLLLWGAGVLAVGLGQLLANLRFARALQKRRVDVGKQVACALPVYFCPGLSSPCLFGLFRPAVYLNAQVNSSNLEYVLLHELTHWRHGDLWWACLRCVCLSLYWFNPLVWLAARLAKNDGELACDEAVLVRLGDACRKEYGNMLLSMLSVQSSAAEKQWFFAATTMNGSKKNLKERITLIAKKPKFTVFTLLTVLVVAALAVGCTFSGGSREDAGLADGTVATLAQELFAARNPYLGDASADSALLSLLGVGDVLGNYTLELETSQQPYVLRLLFENQFTAADRINETMRPYATVLLALIDNVDRLDWQYQFVDSSGEGVFTGSLTKEDAAVTLNRQDIKEFAESAETVEQLLQLVGLSVSQTGGAEPPQAAVLQPGGQFADGDALALAYLACEAAIQEQASEEYAILDAKVNSMELTDSFADILSQPVQVYALTYRLLVDVPEKVVMAGGMTMEDGWLTEYSSMGQPLLVARQNDDGSLTYLGQLYTGSLAETSETLWQAVRGLVLTGGSNRPSAVNLEISLEGQPDAMPGLLYVGLGCSLYYPDGDLWWGRVAEYEQSLCAWGVNDAHDVVLSLWLLPQDADLPKLLTGQGAAPGELVINTGEILDSADTVLADGTAAKRYFLSGHTVIDGYGNLQSSDAYLIQGQLGWYLVVCAYPAEYTEGWGARLNAFAATFRLEPLQTW